MVPRNQLFVLFLLTVLPGITLMGTFSALSSYGILLVVLATLLLLTDILISWHLPSMVAVSFEPLCRTTRAVPGTLPVTIKNTRGTGMVLRIGISFPEQLTTEAYIQRVELPGEEPSVRLQWPFLPLQRGRFLINGCRFEVLSRLRFFSLRKSADCRCEVRVYPDLRKEYRQLSGLFLNRGVEGTHIWKMVGKGREFEKLREYVHGDSFDDIHWKTTAKRNRPVTKVYQIERTQHIYVVIDTSRWSKRTSSAQGKGPSGTAGTPETSSYLERYISASLMLASAAQRHGDCYGLLTFSNRSGSFIKASRGPSHYNLFRDALYNLKPEEVNQDFHEVIANIKLKLRRRSLIIFLTHLDEPVLAEEYFHSISLISRKHLVLAGVLLEQDNRPLFSEKIQSPDQVYDHLENHMVWHNLYQLERKLKAHNVRMLRFHPAGICKQLVAAYVGIKQRQLI